MRKATFIGILSAILISGTALAYDGPVEKKVLTLPSFTTTGGNTLRDVKIGYETYGQLNAAGDNAIVVAHFFSANSHAAGRYKSDDSTPGYWDSIIGAGKPIDTDRYFVIASDSLANLGAKDPNVVTTGPASIDPDTGKPYGLTFPVVTIRDFVNTQKALTEHLGVRKIQAVIGASMGSLQAYEWAAAYPELVERIIPVIPGELQTSAHVIARFNLWSAPIVSDPLWNKGNYYGTATPSRGLIESLKQVTLDARHWGWAGDTFGRKWAREDQDPAKSLDHRFAIEAALDKGASARALLSDANSFLYLARAIQLYRVGQTENPDDGTSLLKAKVLFIPASSDLLFYPEHVTRDAEKLRRQGNVVEIAEIKGSGGHLDGISAIASVGDTIRRFLAE